MGCWVCDGVFNEEGCSGGGPGGERDVFCDEGEDGGWLWGFLRWKGLRGGFWGESGFFDGSEGGEVCVCEDGGDANLVWRSGRFLGRPD